jgi:hypothetical protein
MEPRLAWYPSLDVVYNLLHNIPTQQRLTTKETELNLLVAHTAVTKTPWKEHTQGIDRVFSSQVLVSITLRISLRKAVGTTKITNPGQVEANRARNLLVGQLKARLAGQRKALKHTLILVIFQGCQLQCVRIKRKSYTTMLKTNRLRFTCDHRTYVLSAPSQQNHYDPLSDPGLYGKNDSGAETMQ